jgi:hypothetical protein
MGRFGWDSFVVAWAIPKAFALTLSKASRWQREKPLSIIVDGIVDSSLLYYVTCISLSTLGRTVRIQAAE